MGCVLGTEASAAAGDRRRSTGAQRRSRKVEEHRSVNNAVGATKKEETERQKTTRKSGDFPAAEHRKPRPEPFLHNEQGWPSWLLAAAGDAIQGWTPRRANSFERLAKVFSKSQNQRSSLPFLYFIYF